MSAATTKKIFIKKP